MSTFTLSSHITVSCITKSSSPSTTASSAVPAPMAQYHCFHLPALHLACKAHTLSSSLLGQKSADELTHGAHRRPTLYETQKQHHNPPHQKQAHTRWKKPHSGQEQQHTMLNAGYPLFHTHTKLAIAAAQQPEAQQWLHPLFLHLMIFFGSSQQNLCNAFSPSFSIIYSCTRMTCATCFNFFLSTCSSFLAAAALRVFGHFYHLHKNDYRYRSEIKSKTFGL